MSFSTLYGSKWVATPGNDDDPSTPQCFSTLYGSKWVATSGVSSAALSRYMFQYPLRVEVGCNQDRPTLRISILRGFSTLYGSKWVATRSVLLYRRWAYRFSTLYGSKWVATRLSARRSSMLYVSVPSTGRSGLQPQNASRCIARGTGFSTLYGSKWVATHLFSLYIILYVTVSVPSTGRSGLQHREGPCRFRSVWFQYPLRVEVGCNGDNPIQVFVLPAFQYPLRVEVGCNRTRTQPVPTGFRFQYPLRVEVGCNHQAGYVVYLRKEVSVPSTGRSGLQLHAF